MALNALGVGITFTAKDMASGAIRGLSRGMDGLARGMTNAISQAGKAVSAFQNMGSAARAAQAPMAQWLKQGIDGRWRDSKGRFLEMGRTAGGIAAGAFGATFGEDVARGLIGQKITGVGEALIGGAVEATKEYAGFEQQLAAVGAVTRATAAEMKMLNDVAIKAGIETQFSPTEAAAGLAELATAGQTVGQQVKTIIPVLDLAAGSLGQLNVAGASAAVVGTLNAYSLTADHATKVTDKLLKITNLTNFTARDFAGGLSKAAASGAVFGQSLDDALITMGLLRNRNIDASSASTAYREAVRRLASDSLAQKAAQSAGIKIFDESTGKMRSMIEITEDLKDATADMTDEKRNAIVADVYGARGLLAFSAIAGAQFTKATGEVLHGRDAVAALREEMQNSAGTAEQFKSRMLGTFQGQLTLLKGSVQTAMVSIGETFASTFRPAVELAITAVNGLIGAIRSMPAGVKKGLGIIAAGVGGLLVFVGTLMTTFAAISAAGGVLPILLTIAGATAIAFGPVLGTIALVAAAIYTLKRAADENLGGFGKMVEKVGLAFTALGEALSTGGFTKATGDKLMEGPNAGVRNFVLTIFGWFKRGEEFARSFVERFGEVFARVEPSIKQTTKLLGQIFDMLFSDPRGKGAGAAFDNAAKSGARMADVLVTALDYVVRAINIALSFGKGFGSMFSGMGTELSGLGNAFRTLVDAINDYARAMGYGNLVSTEGLSAWQLFGNVIGGSVRASISGVTFALKSVISAVAAVVEFFAGVTDIMSGLLNGDWSQVWRGIKEVAVSALDAVGTQMITMVEAVLAAVEALAKATGRADLADTVGKAKRAVMAFNDNKRAAFGLENEKRAESKGSALDSVRAKMTPALAEAEARAQGQVEMKQGLDNLTRQALGDKSAANRTVMTINNIFQVDGETIMQVAKRIDDQNAERAGALMSMVGG